MTNKAKNIWIVSLLITLVLIIIGYVYITQKTELISNNIDQASSDKTEYVKTVTLKELNNNDATFFESVPNYMPGRLSSNTIDTRVYPSSNFKEGVHFKIIRIYDRDKDGNMTHQYKFVKDPKADKKDVIKEDK